VRNRIFVTGASGKLGLAVVEELVPHEYEVVGADRRHWPRWARGGLRAARQSR
jgi:nucleoside-diphosphate-sugar epimerase